MKEDVQIIRIEQELRQLGDSKIAKHSQRFFKTGKGQYAEGDIFLGIRIPSLRAAAKIHRGLSAAQISCLLESQFHEERLLALFMLVDIFRKTKEQATRKNIYEIYLANTRYINNWDLVDCSAEHIVGAYLRDADKKPIYTLVASNILWERRISIMSTFHFIKHNEFDDTLRISEILLNDREDLIHKAAGWMLREIGKRNLPAEEEYLKQHCRRMPRTMLRYAIEKFAADKRQMYLSGKV
jgi:3-methyladenine DNA glycosylase AlkD